MLSQFSTLLVIGLCSFATACQSTTDSSAPAGDQTNNSDGSVVEFRCQTPANVDAFMKVLVILPGLPDSQPDDVQVQVVTASGVETPFAATRTAVPPGADQAIVYTYEGSEKTLIVTLDPDVVPQKDKVYPAVWNSDTKLDCTSMGYNPFEAHSQQPRGD